MEKIISTLKRIPIRTWVSIIMVVIVIINYVLTMMGKPLINLGEEEITYVVNTLLSIVMIGYTAWQNNSTSENAIIADEILFALRDGIISKDEIETFIDNHKNLIDNNNNKVETKNE